MISPAERYAKLDKIVTLLELALGDAEELEQDHYKQPMVVSPTPAADTLLVRAISVVADLAVSHRDHGGFVPESMHPPAPSYDERRKAVSSS